MEKNAITTLLNWWESATILSTCCTNDPRHHLLSEQATTFFRLHSLPNDYVFDYATNLTSPVFALEMMSQSCAQLWWLGFTPTRCNHCIVLSSTLTKNYPLCPRLIHRSFWTWPPLFKSWKSSSINQSATLIVVFTFQNSPVSKYSFYTRLTLFLFLLYSFGIECMTRRLATTSIFFTPSSFGESTF